MKNILIAVVLFTLWITLRANHVYKKGAFTFDDGNMMKVRLMEDNSLTYEIYLPNDWKVRVSTTLGNGSKDSFVLSLNKTEVILENYLQKVHSEEKNLKAEGEYLLISKNFEERIFKIRRFIYNNLKN